MPERLMRIRILQRLITAADALEDCLTKVRYCHWPKGFKPVTAEQMDAALMESGNAIKQAKHLLKVEVSLKEKIKIRALAKLTDEERKALNL